MPIQKRKAVYIPVEFWDIMAEDANRHYHPVTIELKNVLYSVYQDRLPKENNKFTPSTVKASTASVDEF